MTKMNQRARLWHKDPHCHWCKTLTVLTTGKLQQANSATIDHLYSKLNPKRRTPCAPGEVRRVLACYTCNQRRSIEECATLSFEERYRRSKMPPKNPLATRKARVGLRKWFQRLVLNFLGSIEELNCSCGQSHRVKVLRF